MFYIVSFFQVVGKGCWHIGEGAERRGEAVAGVRSPQTWVPHHFEGSQPRSLSPSLGPSFCTWKGTCHHRSDHKVCRQVAQGRRGDRDTGPVTCVSISMTLQIH